MVLDRIKDNPYASAKEISLILGYSKRQVERTIARLKEDGQIIRIGSNKSGYWELSEGK